MNTTVPISLETIDAVARLAAQEEDCPMSRGPNQPPCPTCHGTGKVAKWPGLRSPYECHIRAAEHRSQEALDACMDAVVVGYYPVLHKGQTAEEQRIGYDAAVGVLCQDTSLAAIGHLEYWDDGAWQFTRYGMSPDDVVPIRYDDPLTALVAAAERERQNGHSA